MEVSHPLLVLQALDEAVRVEVPTSRPAVLFSGGLDSSIIARLLSRYSNPMLYTVGVEGSYDLLTGERSASILDLEWKGLVVSEDEIMEALLQLICILGTANPVTLSFEMPMHLAFSRVVEEHVFCGQGADELFAGYARYLGIERRERERSMLADLASLMDKGLQRERVIADHWGKIVHYPYLHESVRETVGRIPVEEEFGNRLGKAVLREVALLLDLGTIAVSKKKAAQYGSGIMRAMKRAAKNEGMTLGGFMRQLQDQCERH